MKQYLLLLKSTDFNKSGNIWTSNPINLYVNSQYYNYSYTRSQSGLNLIGDRVFVGTEVTSPSATHQATPFVDSAVYSTDFGEIIRDPATPNILRFIDTKSRIDILSYRHIFTNITGSAYPTFNMQLYEADSESGPWLKSVVSNDSNIIFNRNSKPFIKLELEIFTDGLDIDNIGLVFYLEIGIYDPVSPVLSESTRDILHRFPSWTKLYEDSLNNATPELAIPESVGGKFLNALAGENLDNIDASIDLYSINSFISTADTTQIAWAYVTDNVNANIIEVLGDDVQLARTSSLGAFFTLRPTDYAFFYNPIDRQLITLRKFQELKVNGQILEQEPINVFNEFDEFGARVSLPRLYLESNDNYKLRILDVMINPPTISMEGFKRTVRRELDLWRAYGSTPDSFYSGATPIVYEISDLEKTTPYFTPDGVADRKFNTLVNSLNERYPSNLGYVKWGETVWDYGGIESEGIGRIAARYDVSSSLIEENIQNGVGDLDDFKLSIESADQFPESLDFVGTAEITGLKRIDDEFAYFPVTVDYEWYLSYRRTVPDYQATLAKVGLVYEVDLKAHDNFPTPTTFYANINYDLDDYLIVGNRYKKQHSSSPEYHLIKVFDSDGMSMITFRNKVTDLVYENTAFSTPPSQQLNVYNIENIRVNFDRTWSAATPGYTVIPTNDYRFAFHDATPVWTASPVSNWELQLSTPNINLMNANFLIGSNIYKEKNEILKSDAFIDSLVINSENKINSVSSGYILVNDLVKHIILPRDATPENIYIDVLKKATILGAPADQPIPGSDDISVGGYYIDSQTGSQILVPSSPNIVFREFASPNIPISSFNYFDSATLNFQSTPDYLLIDTVNSSNYPVRQTRYELFKAHSTPGIFSGYIDELDYVYKTLNEKENSFGKDSFLENITINSNSFNLDDQTTYIIKDFKLQASPNSISAHTTDIEALINRLNSAIINSEEISIPIFARRTIQSNTYKPAINPGWVLIGNNEYYQYSNPKEEVSNGKFFELQLATSPKKGAPVIVKVGEEYYRNIVFEDLATPGHFTFYNTETIKGNFTNKLFLAYQNVSNVEVRDTYIDKILFSGLETESHIVEPFNSATPAVVDREYEVRYKVNSAFHIEKDIFNEQQSTYSTTLYLSSTPSVSSQYMVTYESEPILRPKELDLELNQSFNPLSEGFIYASLSDYNFKYIDVNLSPQSIMDRHDEYMNLSLISYDENNNLKPGQTFKIEGDLIAATPKYLTTNDNGFGKSLIRYSGPQPTDQSESTIHIIGIGSSTPNGSFNSDAAGYSMSIPFKITRTYNFDLEVRAVPFRYKIAADGISNNSIIGQVFWKGKPLAGTLILKTAVARTLKDLFSQTDTYLEGPNIPTRLDGSFELSRAILSEGESEPGYWFAYIEIISSEQVRALLAEKGQNIDLDDITISGDIVYWYETYDTLNYYDGVTPPPNAFIFLKQDGADMNTTPGFVYAHEDQSTIMRIPTTPNWLPPRWVPIRRYDQHQLGILGATPYLISDHSLIRPDFKED